MFYFKVLVVLKKKICLLLVFENRGVTGGAGGATSFSPLHHCYPLFFLRFFSIQIISCLLLFYTVHIDLFWVLVGFSLFGRLNPRRRRIDGGLGRGRRRHGSVMIFKLGRFGLAKSFWIWCWGLSSNGAAYIFCDWWLSSKLLDAVCWCLDVRRFLLFCSILVISWFFL
jgi:hypothetical protein